MANILVAEDDFLTRQLLQHSLELDGHNVVTVANGREALELVMSEEPELILLDLMMPGIGGAEVIQQLRGEMGKKELKIVVVTGTADAKKIPGVAQADLVMSKPIPLEELLGAIRSFFD